MDADLFAPWACRALPSRSVAHPDQLPDRDWLPAPVPGTVAEALRANGQWDINGARDLDAEDWWYRTTFDAPAGGPCSLCFDGLAALAEVWVNGRRLLTTDNMFRDYRLDLGPDLRPHNELVIAFRSLAAALEEKRPRPRWKTNLVSHQQLRWHRAGLLGRIPGWSPPVPTIGPWRALRLDGRPFAVSDLRVRAGLEGGDGVVTLHARVDSAVPIGGAVLRVGDDEVSADIRAGGIDATLRVPRPPLWWPHSHGGQPLVEYSVRLRAGGTSYDIADGKVGFRRIETVQGNGFSIRVNGEPVYCRGACWTVADIVRPGAAGETLANDLRLAKDAGANMLRVGGTMVYESDDFFRLCDELGILVWQDFMFANMDYPVDDPGFAANVEAEARYQLARLSPHPCVAVFCGNSEVEQQAAMRGVPPESWRNDWFGTRLPALCAEYSPCTGYVASTPSGGALPFHVREGVAHYYGVGAYLRDPSELRQADVKFTPECLAFANIPESGTVGEIMGGLAPALHHPRWKGRVPRDTGAGWDFEDVRDFYLGRLFAVDPVKMRCFDPERYLQLSRLVAGEMMTRVFGEWRGGHTRNRGGLVWFFKDLWPAAGWGVVDSLGLPKAAYYYLRRAWLSRQITMTDEGLDGLHLHVTNETAGPLLGSVELLLLDGSQAVVARQETACRVEARGQKTIASDELLGGFFDVTYSYRFGPPRHQVAIATLFDDERRVLSEAFHFVTPREPAILREARIEVEAEPAGEGRYRVALGCDHFLQGVSLEADGFLPDDNYFHLPPSRPKLVTFTPLGDGRDRFRATLHATNLEHPIRVRLRETPRQDTDHA